MTLKRPTHSIRLKIGLVFGATFFLGFAGAGSYLFGRVRAVLIEQDNRTLVDRANRLAERVSVYPLVIPLPDRGEVLALWYTTGSYTKQLYESPHFPALADSPAGQAISEADTFRLARLNRSLDGAGQLTVVVGHSSYPLNRETNRIVWLLVLTLVVSVSISGFSAWWLSGWLLAPLRAIVQSAQTVSRAEQAPPIPIPASGDELQELAETINAMLTRIRQFADTQHNFFSAASHELRTPLSILRTEIEVALRETVDDRKRQFLHSQLTELRRLSRLVDDLLAMSQLRAGTLFLRPTRVELDDLTLQLIERYQRSISQRGQFLTIDLDDTVAAFPVWADADKLTNVLLNLLDNAVKYAPVQTPLQLGLTLEGGMVSWSLTNRTTISLPDPARLTQEYYQVEPNNDGYGLGLWISHQVVHQMNGQLTLVSSDGHFRATVRLPMAE
ncbi:sensor histidine kinase [Larkinella harenae]